MSTASKEIGARGEAYTALLLERSGYRIVCRNYHIWGGEIDLIAQKGDILCFVEVKTRARGAMVGGHSAVTVSKQRRIIRAALCYLGENQLECQPRFDVCVVYTDPGGRPQRHDYLKAAFDGSAYEG